MLIKKNPIFFAVVILAAVITLLIFSSIGPFRNDKVETLKQHYNFVIYLTDGTTDSVLQVYKCSSGHVDIFTVKDIAKYGYYHKEEYKCFHSLWPPSEFEKSSKTINQ